MIFSKHVSCFYLPEVLNDLQTARFLEWGSHDRPIHWDLDESLLENGSFTYNTSELRLRDYRAGRACAALALRGVGSSNLFVASDPLRAPVWPQGFVGSISHASQFAVACAAKEDKVLSLGVDVESWISKTQRLDIQDRVVDSKEWTFLDSLSNLDKEQTFSVAFSAKEAVYKALYPMDRKFREFAELKLLEVTEGGLFKMVEPQTGQLIVGRWEPLKDHVICAVEIPSSPRIF